MSTCSNGHGFHRCNNLKVQNLTVLNNQQMRMAFTSCVLVPASHLRVLAPESSPNTDGIHISASTLVQIKNSVIITEVFKNVMDETGHFKACLSEDIRGMLYLYEA